MLNMKKPLELTISELENLIQRKLILYLKDEKINHEEYIRCSRGFSMIGEYITIVENKNIFQ